jgi:hypothetical protein
VRLVLQGKAGFDHALSVGLAMHLGDLDNPLLASCTFPAPVGCAIPVAVDQVRMIALSRGLFVGFAGAARSFTPFVLLLCGSQSRASAINLVGLLKAVGLEARLAARDGFNAADAASAVAILGVAAPQFSGVDEEGAMAAAAEMGLTGDMVTDAPKIRAMIREKGINLPPELQAALDALAPEQLPASPSEDDEANLARLLEAAVNFELPPNLRRQASEEAERLLAPAAPAASPAAEVRREHTLHMEYENTSTRERGTAIVKTGDNDAVSVDREIREEWLKRLKLKQALQSGWRVEDTLVSVSDASIAAARAAAAAPPPALGAKAGSTGSTTSPPWHIDVSYRNTRTGVAGRARVESNDADCVSRDPVVHQKWIDRIRRKQAKDDKWEFDETEIIPDPDSLARARGGIWAPVSSSSPDVSSFSSLGKSKVRRHKALARICLS